MKLCCEISDFVRAKRLDFLVDLPMGFGVGLEAQLRITEQVKRGIQYATIKWEFCYGEIMQRNK